MPDAATTSAPGYCEATQLYSQPPTVAGFPSFDWAYNSWIDSMCSPLCKCAQPSSVDTPAEQSAYCSAVNPTAYPPNILVLETNFNHAAKYSIRNYNSDTCTATCSCTRPMFNAATPDAPVAECDGCTYNNYCNTVLGYTDDPGNVDNGISPAVFVPRLDVWAEPDCMYKCRNVPLRPPESFIRLQVTVETPDAAAPLAPLASDPIRSCLEIALMRPQVQRGSLMSV